MVGKSATSRRAAPNLSKLQKTLNRDTRLRNQFLKDPGAVLAKHGLELSPDRAEQLARFTREVTASKGQALIGGISRRVLGAGARAEVEVSVSVTVRF